jgi:hypothetical protein
MSKRYYYTCPIKALYMMKEFGVKFECKDANGDVYDFQEWYLNSNNISELSLELENFPICIYVKKESEHIFKPRNYDLAGFTRDDGISTIAQYDEAKKAFINGSFRILKKYNPKIIIRDNKQFFMPEVEND